MKDCLFCKIVAGELPSNKIYEDEKVLAFLDINPVNPGHILVVPKTHSKDITEIGEQQLAAVSKVLPGVVKAVRAVTGATGVNVGINSGRSAGQIIFQTNVHIIPRHDGDGLKSWRQRKYQTDNEAKKLAEKIQARLSG